jgi:hypothetical protein
MLLLRLQLQTNEGIWTMSALDDPVKINKSQPYVELGFLQGR